MRAPLAADHRPGAPAASGPLVQVVQPVAVQGAVPLERFDLYIDPDLFPGEEAAIGDELEALFPQLVERVGYAEQARFTALFTRSADCSLHGAAYTERRQVQVFTCGDHANSMAIMAHEIVHQLADDRYGVSGTGFDTLLVEGLATYGAGSYWLAGHDSFRSYVHAMRAGGGGLPLTESYRAVNVEAMNASYYQWASFVEFLYTEFPREQFDRVYVTGSGEPGSADYQAAYGMSFDELAQLWEQWLIQ